MKSQRLIAITICALISASIWSAYLGSWIPGAKGFPVGAVLRDALLGGIILWAIFVSIRVNIKLRGGFDIHLTWFIVVVVCTFLIPFSPDIGTALNGIRGYVLFPAILFAIYLFQISGVKMHKNLDMIINWFLFNVILAAFLGVIDVVTLGEFSQSLGYDPDFAGGDFKQINAYDGIMRATGGLGDALNYGYLMSIGFLSALDRVYRRKVNAWYLVFLMFVATACGVACILTFTRGAIAFIVIATIVYSVTYRSYSVLIVAGIVTFGFLVYVGQDLLEVLGGRFSDSNSESAGSTQGRVDMALKSFEYLGMNPFGAGLGTQGSASRFSAVETRINTDNYFLWVALELGVVGATFFFIYLFVQIRVVLHRSGPPAFRGLMVFLIISSGLVSSAPVSAIFAINYWILLIVQGSQYKQAYLDNL